MRFSLYKMLLPTALLWLTTMPCFDMALAAEPTLAPSPQLASNEARLDEIKRTNYVSVPILVSDWGGNAAYTAYRNVFVAAVREGQTPQLSIEYLTRDLFWWGQQRHSQQVELSEILTPSELGATQKAIAIKERILPVYVLREFSAATLDSHGNLSSENKALVVFADEVNPPNSGKTIGVFEVPTLSLLLLREAAFRSLCGELSALQGGELSALQGGELSALQGGELNALHDGRSVNHLAELKSALAPLRVTEINKAELTLGGAPPTSAEETLEAFIQNRLVQLKTKTEFSKLLLNILHSRLYSHRVRTQATPPLPEPTPLEIFESLLDAWLNEEVFLDYPITTELYREVTRRPLTDEEVLTALKKLESLSVVDSEDPHLELKKMKLDHLLQRKIKLSENGKREVISYLDNEVTRAQAKLILTKYPIQSEESYQQLSILLSAHSDDTSFRKILIELLRRNANQAITNLLKIIQRQSSTHVVQDAESALQQMMEFKETAPDRFLTYLINALKDPQTAESAFQFLRKLRHPLGETATQDLNQLSRETTPPGWPSGMTPPEKMAHRLIYPYDDSSTTAFVQKCTTPHQPPSRES